MLTAQKLLAIKKHQCTTSVVNIISKLTLLLGTNGRLALKDSDTPSIYISSVTASKKICSPCPDYTSLLTLY